VIMLCERCFAPIGDDEPVVRLFGPADGGVRWGYRYQHLGGSPRCVPPRLVAHARPAPEPEPDRRQGIVVRRTGRRLPED
jgi:hypothetical protein